MKQIRSPQDELGAIPIENIELDLNSRDDIPARLLGIQHLYADEQARHRLLQILDNHILPDANQKNVRPGMELRRIFALGAIKQGLGCNFDRLHDLANNHMTLRQFLGHSDAFKDTRYHYQTVVDNVSLLTPELLAEVNALVAESGHAVAKLKPEAPLRGRCDSFVVETNVHYPTVVNLLWDAMRCLVRDKVRAARRLGVPGWRQWKHQSRSVKKLFHRVRQTRSACPETVEAYLLLCGRLADRAEACLRAD